MCGIFGIIGSNMEGKKEILQRMSHVLQHRGSDGSGILFFNTNDLKEFGFYKFK